MDSVPPDEAARRRAAARKRQEDLDQALADSFPASDPVSIATSGNEEAWDDEADPPAAPPAPKP